MDSESQRDTMAPQPNTVVTEGSVSVLDDRTVATYETGTSYGSRRSRGYSTDGFRAAGKRSGAYNRHDRHRSRSRSRSRGREYSKSMPRDARCQSRDHGNGRNEDQRKQRSFSCAGPPGRRPNDDGKHHLFDRLNKSRSLDPGQQRRSESRLRERIFPSKSPRRMRASVEPEFVEWPPSFNQDGTAFVFDARSGMFYETRSDFFYDPKSKLYYGNKKGAYFRYDETQDPPFVEIQKVHPTEPNTTTDVTVLPIMATAVANQITKPQIVINIKTKTSKKRKSGEANTSEPAVVSKAQKLQVANIEKWQQKQAELKADSPGSDAKPSAPGTNDMGAKVSTQNGKVRTTAKGEPICVICKRKFPSVDKLRLHEELSALHKQNLAKLTAASEDQNRKRNEPPQQQQQPEYHDRAQKRRDLHGPVAPNGASAIQTKDAACFNSPAADNLGESNIGNQLLKKMGWPGDSQGKTVNDEKETKNGYSDTAHNEIRKDWERIEALAGSKR